MPIIWKIIKRNQRINKRENFRLSFKVNVLKTLTFRREQFSSQVDGVQRIMNNEEEKTGFRAKWRMTGKKSLVNSLVENFNSDGKGRGGRGRERLKIDQNFLRITLIIYVAKFLWFFFFFFELLVWKICEIANEKNFFYLKDKKKKKTRS